MTDNPLTFSHYQQWFREYDQLRGLNEDRPLESLAHLSEEMGEIARHILRLEGVKAMDHVARDAEITALALELSDAFVFLTKLANHYGIDWDETIRNGMAKAEARWDIAQGQAEAERRAQKRNP
jgi:NTP pyrophosphatase (non-canonical NTP hydrolase)